jgi:hypothetical protein
LPRSSGSAHLDSSVPTQPVRALQWVQEQNLDQCRRTFRPSHVDDGGGIALDPSSLCCEKPLGPSRYTGNATQ